MFKIILFEMVLYQDTQLLEDLFGLFFQYRHFLLDDYVFKNSISLQEALLSEIYNNKKHFYLIIELETNELMGFAYLNNWVGSADNYHSCSINTCFKKKFWGKRTFFIGKQFLKKIFDDYNLIKVKAEVFENNFRVKRLLKLLGFEKEGLLKDETLVMGKKRNIEVYAAFNIIK